MTKVDMKVLSIQITYRCTCGAETSCFSAPASFQGIVEECELCGEHGDVVASVRCVECGKEHTLIINDW